jgi:uncharacterized protein YcbK (DUF882 family)
MTTDVSVAGNREIRRFFRVGDGHINISDVRTGYHANVQLLESDGSLNESGLLALDKVFGFSSDEAKAHISLRLIFLLDYFSDKLAPGKMIELYSGYRNPEYNQKLRSAGGNVAPTSTHMDAMAIDFSIKGVGGNRLWETIREEACCGVGHYGGNTIHLDSGKPRFWKAATSKVNSGESEFNRRIYLSTQYDRYRPGETLRLAISSASDYPFGVKRAIIITKEGRVDENSDIIGHIQGNNECIPITDRTAGRSLYTPLPQSLPPGMYRIHIEFCRIPFPQMPAGVISNPIEIVSE